MIQPAAACEKLFEARTATTAQDAQTAYRLRYRVYCREAGFFSESLYADGVETDGYDEHSAHCLLHYRPTGAVIGTARLILTQGESQGAGNFPFDHVCDAQALYDDKRLPLETTGEISRFCITRSLPEELERSPRRWFEQNWDGEPPGSRLLLRLAKLALMRAVVHLTFHNDVTHWCAVMSPELRESFDRLGVPFTPYGPEVDYHGPRQPCYCDVGAALRVTRASRPDIWELLTDSGRVNF